MCNNTKKILEIIFNQEYDKKNPLASLQNIVPRNHLVVLEKNDTLIVQHEPVTWVYFLLSGYLSVLNHIDRNDDNVIDSLEPLDIVGFIEYLNNVDTYTSYVMADSKCVLYRLPIQYFAKLIQEDASLCYKTLVVFAKTTESNMNRAELKTLFHSKDILGHFLFLQAEKSGKQPYVCPFTRAMLADKLHINLRTLYRYIDFLKENQFLCLEKGKIVIKKEHFFKLRERYGNIVL